MIRRGFADDAIASLPQLATAAAAATGQLMAAGFAATDAAATPPPSRFRRFRHTAGQSCRAFLTGH